MANPKEQVTPISRRSFLREAAMLAAGAGLSLLAETGCNTSENKGQTATPRPQTPQPDKPVSSLNNIVTATATAAATLTATPTTTQIKKVETPTLTPTSESLSLEQILDLYSDSYPEKTSGLERARVLRINESTTPEMIRKAQKGELFFKNTYPKLLLEVAFNREVARLGEQGIVQYLDRAAQGIIDGLKKANPDKSKPFIVALEAGHMSNAPLEKIKKLNQERRAKGLPVFATPTLDTGTGAGGIPERLLNHRLCVTIASKIAADPECASWIPVLNSTKDGFPVDRLEERDDITYAYIDHQDGILPSNYLFDSIGLLAQKAGFKMIELSIHHNDAGNADLRGGWIYTPSTGSFKAETERIASLLKDPMQNQIRKVMPYSCLIQETPKFYWILDVYDGDNQDNVKKGDVDTPYGCVSNLIAAKIRHLALNKTK